MDDFVKIYIGSVMTARSVASVLKTKGFTIVWDERPNFNVKLTDTVFLSVNLFFQGRTSDYPIETCLMIGEDQIYDHSLGYGDICRFSGAEDLVDEIKRLQADDHLRNL